MAFIEAKAKDAGVDKFILKPLFPSSIADCINHFIGRDTVDDHEKEIKNPITFSGKRILLAEDVEINREIIVSLLEPTGIEIDSACNGREAYELFINNPSKYDLIFMDLQMPEMDGFEATRKIRAFEEARKTETPPPTEGTPGVIPAGGISRDGIPIIAMTANVFKEDVEKCLAAGMNSHIGKPIDMERILEKLQQFLRTPEKV
jgi:CheY-like chemotaxis protein